MKKIGLLFFILFFGVSLQSRADRVETTGGTVYEGTIIKMDENELVIKTSKGTTCIPRSKVKSFQSKPSSGSSSTPDTSTKSSVTPTGALEEAAREALRALKKLEARVQVGISYRDYGPALGDAQFEVNQFLESPEAKEKSELAESIASVLGHYQFANVVWRHKVSSGWGFFIFYENKNKDSPDRILGELVLKTYPKAIEAKTTTSDKGQNVLNTDRVISIIWGKASTELKKATSLLSQGSK